MSDTVRDPAARVYSIKLVAATCKAPAFTCANALPDVNEFVMAPTPVTLELALLAKTASVAVIE
jgi:hypothetical protein